MAETLTRPKRVRRSKALDPRERELKRLKLSVCDDTGFRLLLATYDQPKRRDELIARVVTEAKAEKVRVTRLDLAEAGPEANLVGLLRAHLTSTKLPTGWRQAVMVTGIEQRLDYSAGSEGFAFLHQANLLRDALPGAAPVAVVLWLSRMASAALPAQAPDLWHWRAANFDFTGDDAPRLELLRELTTLTHQDDFGFSGEQRRARVQLLQDLIVELERQGPPQSKRQAAERARLQVDLARESWRLGRAAEAVPRFERALEAFRQIGDRQGEGVALGGLGNSYADLGKSWQAIEHYNEALKIAREIGDLQIESQTLGNLGAAYADIDETRQAILYYEKRLAIAREIGDWRGEGNTLGNLGAAYFDLGETRRAINCYEKRLEIAREMGDRQGEGAALGNLGIAFAALGDTRRAIELHRQHLAITREIGNRRGESYALGNLGSAYFELGEPQRAIEQFDKVLRIAREITDRRGEAAVLCFLGAAYAALGDMGQAIEYYEQSLVIARAVGNRRSEGDALLNSALVFDRLGKRNEAIRRMESALHIYNQIEDPGREKARAQLVEWRGEPRDR